MSEKRPNIVIILADDTGYGDPPCYNADSLDPMPSVDKLATEGVRFTDAHSASALCSPSRYALLTGRYYWRTFKRHSLVMPYEGPVIEPSRPTLPATLRKAGYETGCVGKWHLGFSYPSRSEPGSFTTSEADIDFSGDLVGGPADCGFDYFFGTAGCSTSDPPYCFIENRRTVSIPTRLSPTEFHDLPGFYPGLMADDWDEERVDVTHVEKAVSFVDRHLAERPDDPFFLYLPISAPHNPWLPPDFVRGKSSEGPRGDMNALVDWCVGQMVAALDERGLADDTLLIFTSDNGPMAGQNGHRSAGLLRGQKNTAFEGGHRVPFIARWPGRIGAGARTDSVFCLIDLYATLTDVLGITLPEGASPDGEALTSALLGDGGSSSRQVLVSDTGGFASQTGDFAIRDGEWKLVVLSESEDTMARRKQPVSDHIDGRLLFNLGADPGERQNELPEESNIAEGLATQLQNIKNHEKE